MKPQIRLIISLFLLSLLTFGCTSSNDFGNITNSEDSAPKPTPTFRIRIWGDPPDTITPRLLTEQFSATSTPLPPTETSSPTETPLPSNTPEPSLTKILFTGSIVPGRCVQAAVDEKGQADFLYDDVRELVSSADIAVGTLNAALSDYPPHTGCIQTFVLVGSSNNADAMSNAGFDVMSVATNHIKNCGLSNCGDQAFYDTMDNLERVGILPVGAGNNLQEAMEPVVLERNGVRFGFISLGEIESMAFASKDTPGIAPLPEDFDEAEANLRAAIAAALEVSDVVIAMPHWGSDYGEAPNYRQLFFDQVAVDAGANLVIGNHPHVIQGMREIDGIPVFYSLGSFVFDQDWSVETQQGIVAMITFQGTELLEYEVIPVRIDGSGHVQVAESPEAEEILVRFGRLSEELK
jgi:poly-gamma-glutamate capsule biosynthesis protein CapA/YwtB (metallophosphatase superfamily)